MSRQGAQFTIQAAIRQAYSRQHEYVTIEHLLYALLFDEQASDVIDHCGGDVAALKADVNAYLDAEIPKSEDSTKNDTLKQTLGFKRVLEGTIMQASASDRAQITSNDLLVAVFGESESYASYLLQKHGIRRLDVLEYISHGEHPDEDLLGAETTGKSGEGPQNKPLEQYTTVLTDLARADKLDPLIGRETELERIMQVLCRRTRNNPILIGDSGVGKTAIVFGLAQRIAAGTVPDILTDAGIYSLDLGSLLAGTKYRGQFEKRMKQCISALAEMPKPILFIDEIHMIVGAGSASGSAMDVSNMLKPILQSGEIRCVGATTHEDFKRAFEADKALVRRFQKVDILAPSVAESIDVLRGLKRQYETFHEVTYSDDALSSAAELADRYIFERNLPDKAIDVIDETGARNRMRAPQTRKGKLTQKDIEEVIAKIARIPDISANKSDRKRLAALTTQMKAVVFGQDPPIDATVNAIKLSRAGLGHPEQPVGAFLFVGPTGVGKTEVAKQLAQILGIGFKRFDMSEYMEKHTVSRLIGAPPGYVGFDQGGLLTESIRKTPHSVLLLDEIEKAHADLFDILLQVMDHATLTDNNGRQADFKNVILIMTSNAGSRKISQKNIGFTPNIDVTKGNKEIERLFSPEFRNRLTEIITFDTLSQPVMEQIVDKFITQLQTQLQQRNIKITLHKRARQWLAVNGHSEVFGARPLSRLIQRELRQPLAEEILFGRLTKGGQVLIDRPTNATSWQFEISARRTNRKKKEHPA